MKDPNLNLFEEVDLSATPPGLTMATAYAAMEAMARGISYLGDRSTGNVLFEAVCGLASAPKVLDVLHAEIVIGRANGAKS